ncbi:hypothetical protein SAMN05216371_7502 [Streptomyces sp. TLI_053]|uniref:hypothetical protein n=1 Tax=Streptomyces sp. TLI_053 TaxID=1855352 RepID=UPI00087D66DF|nr:hypothetical protein [Streptomyces sp. TLI_053]SDT82709.1 hypothetical protein SAMN05216371_7502 [Streptomyces sp. TLI_053]
MIAAVITPVPKRQQQAARRYLAAGQRTDALEALRAESDLPIAHAPAALAVLARRALPMTPKGAAAVLANEAPALQYALRSLLGAGRRRDALLLLRRTTGVGVVTARRIVAELTQASS